MVIEFNTKYSFDKKKGFKIFYNQKYYFSKINTLNSHFPFIKKLISTKKNFLFDEISNSEFKNITFNFLIFLLVNGDNFPKSRQIPWGYWKSFQKEFEEALKRKEKDITLNFKFKNLELYDLYIKNNSFKNLNYSIINRFKFSYIINNIFFRFFLIGFFILKKLYFNLFFIKNKKKFKIDTLFFSDFDRYYDNNNFFNPQFHYSKEFSTFLKKHKLKIKNKSMVYSKYDINNIFNYLKKIKKDNLNFFLEDFLNLKLGFKIFFRNFLKFNYKSKIKTNSIDEKALLSFYLDFVRDYLPTFMWMYISIKKHLSSNDIKLILGDSEKNFLFFITNMAKENLNKNITSVAFNHEIINDYYASMTYSKSFSTYPNYKLVWNSKIKNLLINQYKIPKKNLEIFIDPRFLNWNKLKKKTKTILLISQGVDDFYETVLDFFNDINLVKKILNKGYIFYFKPHPSELVNKKNKALFNKILNIYNLSIIYGDLKFIPEVSISHSSTLLYELISVGSKGYQLSNHNYLYLDDVLFKKISKKSLKNALLDLLK